MASPRSFVPHRVMVTPIDHHADGCDPTATEGAPAKSGLTIPVNWVPSEVHTRAFASVVSAWLAAETGADPKLTGKRVALYSDRTPT